MSAQREITPATVVNHTDIVVHADRQSHSRHVHLPEGEKVEPLCDATLRLGEWTTSTLETMPQAYLEDRICPSCLREANDEPDPRATNNRSQADVLAELGVSLDA